MPTAPADPTANAADDPVPTDPAANPAADPLPTDPAAPVHRRPRGRRAIAGRIAIAVAAVGAIALPVMMQPWLRAPFSGPKTVTMAAVTLVLLCALLAAAPRGRGRALVLLLALAYLGWWALATVVVHDPVGALIGASGMYQGLASLACYLGAFAAGVLVLRGRRARTVMLVAVTIGASISAAYGLIQLVGLDPLWRGYLDKGRIFSTIGQANALASVLLIGSAAGLGLLLVARGRWRLPAILGAALPLVALLWTQSRGAYVGIVAGLALVGLILVGRRRRRRRAAPHPAPSPAMSPGRTGGAKGRRVAGIGLAAVVVIGALAIGSQAIVRRAEHTLDRNHGSIAMHRNLVVIGFAMALDHPLLGVGPEAFRYRTTPYLGLWRFHELRIERNRLIQGLPPIARASRLVPFGEALAIARRRPESPHNVAAAVASGVGLPGLALYVALLVVALAAGVRRAIRAPAREAILVGATVAAVVGWVVADQFMTGSVAPSWVGWLLAGSLAGTVAWRRSGRRGDPQPGPAGVEGDPVVIAGATGVADELERA